MQEVVLRIKVDGSSDHFSKFESSLVQEVRDLMLERIKEYLEQPDCEVSDCFNAKYPEYAYHRRVKRKLRCYFGDVWIPRSLTGCKGRKDVYPLDCFLPQGGVSQFPPGGGWRGGSRNRA